MSGGSDEDDAPGPEVVRPEDRPPPLADLAGNANEHHRRAERAARRALEHAREAGRVLIEVKDRLPYGEWGDWLEENFAATPQTARNYMRIARRWSELTEAEDENENAFSIREAIDHLAASSSAEDEDEDALGREAGWAVRKSTSPRYRLEEALGKLPEAERDRALNLVQMAQVSTLTAARKVRSLADSTERQRERLYELAEADDHQMQEEAVVQLGLRRRGHFETRRLPPVAQAELEDLLEAAERRRPTSEGSRIDNARHALTLQSLLRWAIAFCERVGRGPPLDGMWVARSPEKVAEDCRRVAEWMTEFADAIEEAAADGGLPFPGEGGDGG